MAASAATLVPSGNVLMVMRSGILKHTLPAAINAVPCTLNQDMRAVDVRPKLNPKFLLRFVQGFNDELLASLVKQGATVESIDSDLLRLMEVPVPPKAEQDALVYDLRAKLDAMLLYETSEVQQFAEAIVDGQVTHQKLYSLTQAPTDRFNGRLKQLTDAIGHWEAAWRRAKEGDDTVAMGQADAQRSELTTERDALIVFREGLGKFVRTYEYVAQLVDFGDPPLEGYASFVRLLQERLNGVPTEQVDLGDLTLTHYKLKREGGLDGVLKYGSTPTLSPITDNGLREARDRETAYLSELIDKLNQALGKDISDHDQVALAVHVSEKLRANATVMAQVQNNPKDQAMKTNLPGAAVQAIVGAREAHEQLATRGRAARQSAVGPAAHLHLHGNGNSPPHA